MTQRLVLTSHPTTPCRFVSCLTVDVAAEGAGLVLDYRLEGDIAALRLPTASAGRQDDLWQHTCFEAFMMPQGGIAYREYNLSPRAAWACYDFTSCRTGRQDAAVDAPPLEVDAGPQHYHLHTRLMLPAPGPVRIALATVLETKEGELSYWALHHPSAEPDFHDPQAFALRWG